MKSLPVRVLGMMSLMVLVAMALVACADRPWFEYKAADGSFVASFPFEPTKSIKTMITADGSADVTFYSGGWGRSYVPDRESAADAIVAQASATIDFPRVIRAAYADGVRFFIEMGPGASCSRMIGQILEG